MPRITLPDGSFRDYDEPVSAARVAADIGPGLAKAAIGAKVDGVLRDLSAPITGDASLSIVTAGGASDTPTADALFLLRHSCAHVMAEAIQRLHPGTQLVYGPPVENGFYYDIALPPGEALSSTTFEAIEAEMAKIIAENRPFTRYELPVGEGMTKLRQEGSKYKLDNAERAVEGGAHELSWYATGAPGKDWEDLCRGPHVPSTGRIGAFKLTAVASAYWHGDAASDSLTRVYGTAFPHARQLTAYLEALEEAKRRDHRVIGKKLGLFHIDESVGQGLALWHPNGAVLRRELEEFIREELLKQGYRQVYTPHIAKLELYKTSGHFPYYQESQYPPLIHHEHLDHLAKAGMSCASLANDLKAGNIDGYLLKPMNCPLHVKIFDAEPRSYRDLPVRLAEFGTVYRWEQSGELNGLTRVRGFTQDDAHLFCTEEQVEAELLGCLHIVNLILTTLGMTNYRVRVGRRAPDSSKYVGHSEKWDKAEAACEKAARSLGVPFSSEAGEAAFYGPKIDFMVRDVIGREWQLGTVQVDYNLPERFDLSYVGPDNKPHRPVMVHRAPFGSFERFVGILIEHFGGSFPTWLAPIQARVVPVSEKFVRYGGEVLDVLRRQGARVDMDDSDERVTAKIKAGAELKIPYLLVVGGRDEEARTVSVRQRGPGDLGAKPLDEFARELGEEIARRALPADFGKAE